MKKYILLGAFIASLFIGACSPYTDEKPGGVAIQDLCGTWVMTPVASYGEFMWKNYGDSDYVNMDLGPMSKSQLDAVNDWLDIHGMGTTVFRTYNTSNNDIDSLWFDDDNFWGEKFKIGCDYGKLSFGGDTVASNSGSGCEATIRFGQVLKGAATTPRGQKADSIIVYVYYNDGYDVTYKFSGFRYTGYSADLN